MSNFGVEVQWDGSTVVGVSRVQPLRRTVEAIEYRDGLSGATVKVPGRVEVDAVELARAVTDDLAFDEWASGPPLRKGVDLRLTDASNALVVTYRLHRCWVVGYAVTPDLATGAVTEAVTLSVDWWERVRPTVGERADLLARERGTRVQRVGLAGLITGRLKETEAAVDGLLAEAQAAGSVLLLDEADALFGHRTELRDGHDKYADVEVSYLLDRLSTYDGAVAVVPPEQP